MFIAYLNTTPPTPLIKGDMIIMFAIIKLQGKQHIVSKGDILEVEKMDVKKDQVIKLDQVLAYNDGENDKIGQPYVSGASVSVKVLDPLKKGKKIHILKFKAKKRYIKRMGFRPQLTVLEVEGIVCSDPS